MTKKIINPILRGFNPDASLCKVGEDYYIATSTFEWWPGVEIYHSRDLVNWELAAEPLSRLSQANLVGNYNSGSIWAPHLSYSEGKFWLLYTDVKTSTAFKDTLNYVISADSVEGEWSEPAFVTASGFDPAFFHDEDGEHYIMSMLFDHRLDKPNFAGLVIQAYDLKNLRLIGKRQHFFHGTDLGVCEGPQILKKDGWYYLLCAAGGTGYSHASTVCRSKNVMGPYELSPFHPFLTTKPDPTNPLQKSGHASFVKVNEEEWYIIHICARPLTERGNCVLGRETALQKIEWVDGWPRLANGTMFPELEVEPPSIASAQGSSHMENAPVQSSSHMESAPAQGSSHLKNAADVKQRMDFSAHYDFSEGKLSADFKSLRRPLGDKCSLTEHPGYLRLYGEQSLSSLHEQTLIARRWQHTQFRAETEMTFEPESFQQMAGLVLFYDTDNWDYLHVSMDGETNQRYLQVETADCNRFSYASERIFLTDKCSIGLAVEVNQAAAQFYFRSDESAEWQSIGHPVAADHLSDDYIKANGKLAFTGAMVGLCCQDMDNHTAYADFNYFDYREFHR